MTPEAAVAAFVDAFVRLDWERFCACFAPDATVFFPPSAGFALRAEGRAQIEAVFGQVFERARQRRSEPPYLDIVPEDLHVQQQTDTALVTFHLREPGSLGRRTLVLERRDDTWRIVHLHASAISE